jgi:hypothetical protein
MDWFCLFLLLFGVNINQLVTGPFKRGARLLLCFVLVVGSGVIADAATITVSSTITPGYTLTESAADARYKFDANSWDMGLFIPATRNPNGSNTANLGSDINSFNGVTQNFKLAFSGNSLTYTLGTTSISRPGLASINALDITQTLTPPLNGGYTAAMTIQNLAFTGATGGTFFSLNGLALPGQTEVDHEYIFSDTDFTKFAWTLSGQVTLSMVYVGVAPNTNENLKMDIYGGSLTPSVPDVGTKYLVALGLALILFGSPRLQKRINSGYRTIIGSNPRPNTG